MPLVSVIIPTYGHASLILETLDSVFAQSFTDYEVIVVNDGSPDHTADVVRPLVDSGKIRYFEIPNGGVARARNFGISKALGEFIALLDDDDLWPPDKLEWQVEEMRKDCELLGIGGTWRAVGVNGELGGVFEMPSDVLKMDRCFRENPFISPGQVLVRASALRSLNGFDPGIWGCDDWDLWIRLSARGPLRVENRVSLLYRFHAGNASKNRGKMVENGLAVLQKNAHLVPTSERAQLQDMGICWIYSWSGRLEIRSLPKAFREFRVTSVLKHFAILYPFALETGQNRRFRAMFGKDVMHCLKQTIFPKRS